MPISPWLRVVKIYTNNRIRTCATFYIRYEIKLLLDRDGYHCATDSLQRLFCIIFLCYRGSNIQRLSNHCIGNELAISNSIELPCLHKACIFLCHSGLNWIYKNWAQTKNLKRKGYSFKAVKFPKNLWRIIIYLLIL